MIVLIDAGGRISWVSPSAGQLLGSEPSELTGTDVLSIVHEEDQAAVIAGIEAVMRGESVRVEYRVQNEAGDWIWLESTGNDLLDDPDVGARSEEHTSELQSLMRTSSAVFCLKKKKNQ